MNALSIHQPWATLIALPDGDDRSKRVENRHWPAPTQAIGHRLAIHASKSRESLDPNPYADVPGVDVFGLVIADMQFGAIVATATLAGCVKVLETPDWNRTLPEWATRRWPWLQTHQHVEGPYCWVLTEVIALPRPIPFKGAQRIFQVPDDAFGDQPTRYR